MISKIPARMVQRSIARPRALIAASLVLALVCGLYLVTHITVRTDIDSLISKDLPWRKTETALENAFVSQGDDMALVVDAPTPEQAADVANKLAERLAAHKTLFAMVQRPGGGAFLEKEALLFQPLADVKTSVAALIEAQPLLGPVAADPSLRGVAGTLTTSLTGAEEDKGRLDRLAPAARGLDAALARAAKGDAAPVSWRALMTGETVAASDRREIVALTPKLDYTASDPSGPAYKAIHEAMAEIGLKPGVPTAGVDVKITGSVAMEADELANLGEATGPIAIGCLLATIGILFMGLRSRGAIFAIVMTVLTGLAVTASLGLLMFQKFTLVSVAFLPLFVGLGIDFAIQFAIRYRTEAGIEKDPDLALIATGRTAGPGVALAAAATGFGFLSFFPTPYKGVSELGLIAGVGMAAGALLALTVLPAWLKVLRRGPPSTDADLVGFAWLYRVAERRRRGLLLGAGVVLLIGLVALPKLTTDFDPISLRSAKDVSVKTFLELTHDPDITPNRLSVLAASPQAAEALAVKLRALPAVRNVYTVNSLIPSDQAAKLAVIHDANLILDTTLNPFDVVPPPSDAETAAALKTAGARLIEVAGAAQTPSAQTARSLGQRLSALAAGDAHGRDIAATVLTTAITPALNQVRATLTAEPVTLDTLPPEIKADWISAKGEAKLDVSPSGDPASPANLLTFITAVRGVVPDIAGPPVAVVEAGRTILGAFIQASILSTIAISLLLAFVLRQLRDVALTMAPVAATLVFTLATLALTGQPINLENLIALPLLLGIGVSFNIYSVVAWREGANRRTRAALSHAILFSALTTGASFMALALSAHPGTASLGRLLLITLGWTLVGALFLQPALLASAKRR